MINKSRIKFIITRIIHNKKPKKLKIFVHNTFEHPQITRGQADFYSNSLPKSLNLPARVDAHRIIVFLRGRLVYTDCHAILRVHEGSERGGIVRGRVRAFLEVYFTSCRKRNREEGDGERRERW